MSERRSKDVLGWRAKIGVVVPSTNTIVQPEMEAMRVEGVTNHIARVNIPNVPLSDNASFSLLIEKIEAAQDEAIEGLVSAAPDHVLLGISAETFWGGANRSAEQRAHVEKLSGRSVSLASDAVDAALKRLGAKKIAIVAPYQDIGGDQVRQFFGEIGYEVIGVTCLPCASPVAIAEVPPSRTAGALRELAKSRPDALIQVGTNLSFAADAPKLEAELGLPVIAINTALYRHALDALIISGTVEGFGPLLSER